MSCIVKKHVVCNPLLLEGQVKLTTLIVYIYTVEIFKIIRNNCRLPHDTNTNANTLVRNVRIVWFPVSFLPAPLVIIKLSTVLLVYLYPMQTYDPLL